MTGAPAASPPPRSLLDSLIDLLSMASEARMPAASGTQKRDVCRLGSSSSANDAIAEAVTKTSMMPWALSIHPYAAGVLYLSHIAGIIKMVHYFFTIHINSPSEPLKIFGADIGQ